MWHVRSVSGALLALGLVGLVGLAAADEPAAASAPHLAAPPAGPKEPATEIDGVPVVGGDTDIGFGIGELSGVARLEDGFTPYRWRVETGAFISFKLKDSRLDVPYQDYYALFDAPLPGLRLMVRPSFTDEGTQGYYGLGDASALPASGGLASQTAPFYQYSRIHTQILGRVRFPLTRSVPALSGIVGAAYTQNWVGVPAGTKLAEDRVSPDPIVRSILAGPDHHGVAFFEYGLVYDDRDNELSTKNGQYHQLKLRLSPGGTDGFLPYGYGQADLILRGYKTIVPRYLTLAARLVTDLLFGDPPFYELARYAEDTYAIGGSLGVRGVPAPRYYGKIKVFGNLEARSELWSFTVLNKPFIVGTALFLDGGRVWADYHRDAALDGTGLGLKYGLGGGLRVQEGQTFVVRADIAWSPDAQPIGAYFLAGQMF